MNDIIDLYNGHGSVSVGEWLSLVMKSRNIKCSVLHLELQDRGFKGNLNNIAMWRSGAMRIPLNWLPAVCEILGLKKSEQKYYVHQVLMQYLPKSIHPFLYNHTKNLKSRVQARLKGIHASKMNASNNVVILRGDV